MYRIELLKFNININIEINEVYFLLNLNGQYFLGNIYLRILFRTSFQLFRYPIEFRGTVEIHSYLLFTESDYCAC